MRQYFLLALCAGFILSLACPPAHAGSEELLKSAREANQALANATSDEEFAQAMEPMLRQTRSFLAFEITHEHQNTQVVIDRLQRLEVVAFDKLKNRPELQHTFRAHVAEMLMARANCIEDTDPRSIQRSNSSILAYLGQKVFTRKPIQQRLEQMAEQVRSIADAFPYNCEKLIAAPKDLNLPPPPPSSRWID